MTLPIEAMGYHVGIVVRSVDACTANFDRLLGGKFATWETRKPPPAWMPELEESHLRVSYGRYGGMSLEFIEVLEGRGMHARFLEEHGEGVQHLGFWVPDVAVAAQEVGSPGTELEFAL